MTFAFLIMGKYNSQVDRAAIHDGAAQIIGVSSLENAKEVAKQLCQQGIGCIELCGAFGPEGTRQIIQAVENKIPVGYITHLPEQDDVYRAAFAK